MINQIVNCKREDHIIKKLVAYVILGIHTDGYKEVISLQIGENESSKYWLGVFNELKNRGVKDIMVLCADGLSRIKEAITVPLRNWGQVYGEFSIMYPGRMPGNI